MRKAKRKRTTAKRLPAVSVSVDELLFEVDGRELKTLLAARAVRRRQLAQRQRDILTSLVAKGAEHGLNRRSPGTSRLTPSDFQILDLLPQRTYE